jgi:glycosyltransferase involved in cell wall biosynthesis
MFICQIIASRGNGGLEKHVRELSISLVEQGHRVLVIGDPVFIHTLPLGVEHESINMGLSRYNPWVLYQLYKCLRKHQFDVIHAQADKAARMLASLLSVDLKAPAVATIHNMKSNVEVYRRFAQTICVSHYLASQIGAINTAVIYNGIQLQIVQPVDLIATYHLSLNKPVICAVGRLVPAKGFDVLLDAIDGMDVSLLIVGEGPERKALEGKITQMQANTHVCLIGHHDNPSALMHAADGVVISSRREGFSYVLCEALMSGANILSTDVPVANEVLPRALIVAVDDAVQLRNRLTMLLGKPSDWAALMLEPQRFTQQEMTTQQMTKKTIALYQRVCKTI